MKNKLISILMISFVITLIISTIIIIKWSIDNNTNQEILDIIHENVVIKEITTTTNNIDKQSTTKTQNIYYDYTKINLIDVDLNELTKINKDTKGWIQVKGTNINYPYVQTKNNDYYLTRSFDKKYTDAGWVFMDYRNNPKEFDKNTIIYAHARKNNTMFGELDKLLKKDYYNNLNNHFINISTLTQNSIWQVFSVYHLPTTSDYLQIKFANDSEYDNFLKLLKSRSSRNFKTEVSTSDKILTLSTCYNDEEKLVVHAKLINEQPK